MATLDRLRYLPRVHSEPRCLPSGRYCLETSDRVGIYSCCTVSEDWNEVKTGTKRKVKDILLTCISIVQSNHWNLLLP